MRKLLTLLFVLSALISQAQEMLPPKDSKTSVRIRFDPIDNIYKVDKRDVIEIDITKLKANSTSTDNYQLLLSILKRAGKVTFTTKYNPQTDLFELYADTTEEEPAYIHIKSAEVLNFPSNNWPEKKSKDSIIYRLHYDPVDADTLLGNISLDTTKKDADFPSDFSQYPYITFNQSDTIKLHVPSNYHYLNIDGEVYIVGGKTIGPCNADSVYSFGDPINIPIKIDSEKIICGLPDPEYIDSLLSIEPPATTDIKYGNNRIHIEKGLLNYNKAYRKPKSKKH